MKKILLILCFLQTCVFLYSQHFEKYNPSATLKTQLIHTQLKVSFDIQKEQLFGEELLTARPYFYSTDSLILDAKAMLIHEVALVQANKKTPLKYTYNGKILSIFLGKVFTKKDIYTIFIKYTAQPNEVSQKGSAAITDAKGLYFINPRGEETDKPTQIWTQGETESSSCWFPTIDSPNQKTSQEIYITVPDKFVTLSNGSLKSQVKDGKGNRTDYWKFDKKHAPYLFFMGIGDFAIVKDKWKNIPVDYYVEPEYKDDAMGIFGNTPDMINFFSEVLKYPFPWEKYHQIVCRDYVSGAMENTTAVIHAENAHQKMGQIIDENTWEDAISHELFHHWFGDLVTTESWANLTVNESFANYSEYLWREHKYGKDHAEALKFRDIQGYMLGENFNKHLVRFDFGDKEDMFDGVSYNKGGYILHMLRKYLGDDAFFDGLQLYLKQNEYKAAEAHHLRLALEEVSGKDLNWFFNQWYYNSGHPILQFSYAPIAGENKVKVKIIQTQKEFFQFPFAIDVYTSKGIKRQSVWVKANENNEFILPYTDDLVLVNPNADHVILCEIKQQRTTEQMMHLYKNSKEYMDRKEAIEALSEVHLKSPIAQDVLILGMNDVYFGLRVDAIKSLHFDSPEIFEKSKSTLAKIASSDPKTLVQAAAISALKNGKAEDYKEVFLKGIQSKSFSVFGSSLSSLYTIDKGLVKRTLEPLELKYYASSEELKSQLSTIIVSEKMESKIDFIATSVAYFPFVMYQDPKAGKILQQGFDWIMGGNYEKATQMVVSELVKIYPEAKKYGAGNLIKDVLNKGLNAKKSVSKNSNNATSIGVQIKAIEDGLLKVGE